MSNKNTNVFEGGIAVPYNKLTRNTTVQNMPVPDTVYIPLPLQGGKQSVAVVGVGDTVAMGQLIARDVDDKGQRIFSSVSGTVTSLSTKRPTTMGIANHIEIQNDKLDTPFFLPKLENPTPEQIKQRIFESGIIGMGGGGFPSHIKANVQKPVSFLVLNGIECEPYATCDYKLMKERAKELVQGVRYLAHCLKAPKSIIGIKAMNSDLFGIINHFIKPEDKIEVKLIQGSYPLGSEKHLVFSATGKKVPSRGLPIDVGAVVFNVTTAYAVYQAVEHGITSFERIVTVTGRGVKSPKDILVRVGTPFDNLLEFVGYNDGVSEENKTLKPIVKLVAGGPMMGSCVASGQVVVTKTTGCVLAMTEDETAFEEEGQCINCAACAKACPMRLMPMFIVQYGKVEDGINAAKYGAKECILCGCCSFVCPAKIPLVQHIKESKKVVANTEKQTGKKL